MKTMPKINRTNERTNNRQTNGADSFVSENSLIAMVNP